jgi:hypothetical protein
VTRTQSGSTGIMVDYSGGSVASAFALQPLHPDEVIRFFKAYDHTPRGRAAHTPIVVARVRGNAATAKDAVAIGARLLHNPDAHGGG